MDVNAVSGNSSTQAHAIEKTAGNKSPAKMHFESAYEKSDNSDVLLISDSGRAQFYYSNWMNTGAPNSFGKTYTLDYHEDFVSIGAERYAEISAEIDKTFAEDDPLKEIHMEALGKALKGFIDQRIDALQLSISYGQKIYESDMTAPSGETQIINPLSKIKGFDIKAFTENLKSLTDKFVKSFISQFNSDGGKKALEELFSAESLSTSQISYKDLRVLMSDMEGM